MGRHLLAAVAGATTVMAGDGPCDIYGNAGSPCVAAHSVVRALYGSYTGALYQVKRYDGQTKDIGVTATGAADAAAQDAFCGNTPCVVQRIYDQVSNRRNSPTTTIETLSID